MNHVITTELEPSGAYLTLKFTGDLVHDKVELFVSDLEKSSQIITTYYKETGKKIHILLDMTDFTGNYNLDALAALVEFAKNNKMFVEKTASFGGADKVKMAGEIAITLSNRDNIQIFDTKEEAVKWLLEASR